MDSSEELEWYKHVVGRQEDTALYPVDGWSTAHVHYLGYHCLSAAMAATFMVNDSRASALP